MTFKSSPRAPKNWCLGFAAVLWYSKTKQIANMEWFLLLFKFIWMLVWPPQQVPNWNSPSVPLSPRYPDLGKSKWLKSNVPLPPNLMTLAVVNISQEPLVALQLTILLNHLLLFINIWRAKSKFINFLPLLSLTF